MTKQNIGFIAPFALNILAYVLVWNFFVVDKGETPTIQNEVPAAFLEEVETDKDGAFIMSEETLFTAMNEE